MGPSREQADVPRRTIQALHPISIVISRKMPSPSLIPLVLLLSAMSFAQALGGRQPQQQTVAPDLSNVGIDQDLDAQVPLDLAFRDENGMPVMLQQYFDGKPVILSLVYYNCPMLCSQVLSGVTDAVNLLKLDPGKDYRLLTVSFDPKDTPQGAARQRAEHLQHLARPGAGQDWHFLTGSETSIQQLTRAVGFRYKWDPTTQQFYHATAIMLLTPQGKVSKYFYGVEYNPTDLRLGLIQASHNQIGSVVDQILLFCCKYNATTGKYDFFVGRILSIAGAFTLVILGGFLFVMFRYGKPKPSDAVPGG